MVHHKWHGINSSSSSIGFIINEHGVDQNNKMERCLAFQWKLNYVLSHYFQIMHILFRVTFWKFYTITLPITLQLISRIWLWNMN